MMRNDTGNKALVLGIIVLFFCMSISTSIGTRVIKKSNFPLSNGKTLYVGGSGQGNYTKIQDAINDANEGDTVFVFDDSSPYYENIVIDESINLVGEDKETTIIDGQRNVVVKVTEDDVTIIGFSITNALGFPHMGIWADKVDYCTFSDNIIYSNYYGIELYGSNNQITNNIIYSITKNGIYIPSGDFNIIANNIIHSNNNWSISIFNSPWNQGRNNIINNSISNNYGGIKLMYSPNNTINLNTFKNNTEGIKLLGEIHQGESINNVIYHNNFINNTVNAEDYCNNTWDDGKYGNYWSDYEEKYPDAKKKWWKGIWDTPYEIEGGNNKDNYPLIKQWPNLKSRAITRDTALYNFYWFRFLGRFPLLKQLFFVYSL